jgi:hypothetical protein
MTETTEANENDILSNQTNFFDEELMEQSPPSLPIEEDPQAEEKAVAAKKRKKLFVIAGAATFGILLFGIGLLAIFAPRAEQIVRVTPSPIALQGSQNETEISQRLDELEADVRTADPIEVGFPFPPINFNLFLDQPQRR